MSRVAAYVKNRVAGETKEPQGLMRVGENFSFAPSGLNHLPLPPTACAVGCILSPLRDCESCHCSNEPVENGLSRIQSPAFPFGPRRARGEAAHFPSRVYENQFYGNP